MLWSDAQKALRPTHVQAVVQHRWLQNSAFLLSWKNDPIGPICSSNPRILLFEFLKRERSEKYPEKEKKMERSFT